MSKWIRWSGLTAFIVIVALLAAFILFLSGPLLRMALETGGTHANGAVVDVGSVSVSVNPLGLRIDNVAVTDSKNPMRNALEFRTAVAELELAPLWLGHGIIRELSVEGLRFGTDRTVSGAVVTSAEPGNTGKVAEAGPLDMVELPSADDILARETLQTETAGKALQDGYEQHKNSIDNALNAVPDERALAAYEKELAALISDDFRSLEDFRERKQKLDELKARFKADKAAVAAARQAVKDGRRELEQRLSDLRKAPATDLQQLKSKYALDASGAANVSALLFGPEAGEWAQQTLYWYEKIKPYLARDSQAEERALEAQPQPRDGRFIQFSTNDPWPEFLIRSARISAELDAGNLLLELTDATNDQPLLGRPLRLVGNSNNMKGLDDLTLELEMDHRTAAGRDSLTVSIKDWQPGRMELGVGNASLDSARVQINALAVVQNERLNAEGRAVFADARFTSEGKTTVARELGRALAEIGQFSIDARATGKLSSPSVSMRSDLDKQLNAAFSQRLQQKQDELQRQLEQALQEKLAAYAGESSAELARLTRLEGSLDERFSAVSKLADAELEDYRAQQERKAREKADKEKAAAKAEAERKKKEAEQKAKEQLKKLF